MHTPHSATYPRPCQDACCQVGSCENNSLWAGRWVLRIHYTQESLFTVRIYIKDSFPSLLRIIYTVEHLFRENRNFIRRSGTYRYTMSVKWKQVVAMAFALPAVSAQQPYNNWDLAYEAAEKLVSSWSIEERANISVRNGIAPSYIPFTPVDGTQLSLSFQSTALSI